MVNDDLREISNLFASEFNSRELHDRVLCFQFIDDELSGKHEAKCVDDDDLSEPGLAIGSKKRGFTDENEDETNQEEKQLPLDNKHDEEKNARKGIEKDDNEPQNKKQRLYDNKTEGEGQRSHEDPERSSKQSLDKTRNKRSLISKKQDSGSVEEQDLRKPQNKQKQGRGTVKSKKNMNKNDNKTRECENSEDEKDETANETKDEEKRTTSKLFVHSQWLAVQSPYFKALFYSGMKETFTKEVVMMIYEHELLAHLTLIEAMYKFDVLDGKDHLLISKVLVLAHKYDVRHVIKKCKYILLSTTPSLEICEFILREAAHLEGMTEIYKIIEKFLVKEFTPIDKTWTMDKFADLSEAALKLLLGSDNLATQSENTIFVALMRWVELNIGSFVEEKPDLLDVVRFQFMSVDFLHDVVQNHVVASKIPGFSKYLVKGLAYHGFSKIRRNQLDPKPKKRPALPKDDGATFSWVIDEELQKTLSDSLGDSIYSEEFWFQGYQMQLDLSYEEDQSKCSFYLSILNLGEESCLNVSYRAESILFAKRILSLPKTLFTDSNCDWGWSRIKRNNVRTGTNYTIDVWVDID
ncbi:BTB/POZ domain-containing protein POB1-like [Dendronephthya gigantea]|uniref:BTB/POZ domain-containing protein POB1-like n=1 Tax=Dendronephthya gigantea TaxID=151771 RepID=UPI00106A7C88|nr:BTB/POZ domain-containing protein POB1-like [Dendronephthya gigantea]